MRDVDPRLQRQEFDAEEVGELNGARWVLELLLQELKSSTASTGSRAARPR